MGNVTHRRTGLTARRSRAQRTIRIDRVAPVAPTTHMLVGLDCFVFWIFPTAFLSHTYLYRVHSFFLSFFLVAIAMDSPAELQPVDIELQPASRFDGPA